MKARFSPESLTSPPKWVTETSSVAYTRNEAIAFSKSVHQNNASEVSGIDRLVKVIDAAKAVICCSCYDIEGEYLNLYKKLVGKHVIPIGLLVVEISETTMFEWLDKQAAKSVFFVGFGSECKLSKKQVFEIHLSSSSIYRSNYLIRRRSDRGLVCMGWIPQEILAHSHIGGSLFHSRWGSTIETLQFGKTLLCYHSLLIIKRNEDGTFTRNEITKSLRQAMVLEEGEELRVKTR
ncbi:UDP-glucosyltransferase family protein, putative [Medicago truncatula]|uniref:UDP-glucosyltransferase family protein, putative n=1 Tax=Medicago truncatula TaxID=3880 RepID=A0A072TZ65_MEDTR|nr:UDP-glucosyltransferase family protein, putative [Medicago truncatula]